MSKADIMFEELGYKLSSKNKLGHLIYEDNGLNNIYIGSRCWESKHISKSSCGENVGFELNEFIAVNEKLKELGWIND